MSKKDYVLIASALKKTHAEAEKQGAGNSAHIAIDFATEELARKLKRDNPSFQVAKFLKAAGCYGPMFY